MKTQLGCHVFCRFAAVPVFSIIILVAVTPSNTKFVNWLIVCDWHLDRAAARIPYRKLLENVVVSDSAVTYVADDVLAVASVASPKTALNVLARKQAIAAPFDTADVAADVPIRKSILFAVTAIDIDIAISKTGICLG